MARTNRFLSPVVAAAGLAVLLSSSAFAEGQRSDRYPNDRNDNRNQTYQSNRISTQGRVTSVTREGDRYRVQLNRDGYSYYVPVTSVRNRDIRMGDQIRIGGIISGDYVNADYIAFSGDQGYNSDPSYRGVPNGSTGWMSGTVVSVNRKLNYVTIRDDQSGQRVKIDTRHIESRRSANIWQMRGGQHISVNGSWENRNTFDASRVQF